MSSDIRWIKLYSANLEARLCPKTEAFPNKNQRERGTGPCRLYEGLDKVRQIVPTAL